MADGVTPVRVARSQFWMRPMEMDHVAVINRWFEQIEDLSLFDRGSPLPTGLTASEAGWREMLTASEPRRNYWYVVTDDEDELVGLAGLQDINYVHGDAVLPLFIAEPVRRRGIAIRTGALLLDLAFCHLRMVRVTSYFRADNAGSRRLMERVGFTEEGRLRRAWFAGERHHDIVVIGMLGDEWSRIRRDLVDDVSPDLVVTMGRAAWGTRSWPPPRGETDAAAGARAMAGA